MDGVCTDDLDEVRIRQMVRKRLLRAFKALSMTRLSANLIDDIWQLWLEEPLDASQYLPDM